jgi:hypothetical protein
MSDTSQKQIIIVQSTKNPGIAAILGFLFGPLGLLYVGVTPALIMFGVNILVAIFTAGIGLFLTWPLCAIVGYSRANLYNKKLLAGTNQ